MRVVELSDHPRAMLEKAQRLRAAGAADERRRFGEALAQHQARVTEARRIRDLAWSQRRWWAWLRAVLAVRREHRRVPRVPGSASLPTDQEAILTAGIAGEHLVAAGLGRDLGDDWTLFRGYRNRGGEIDHLLLGPRGLFAIEGKHRNATVDIAGDRWWFTRYDNYGNAVDRGEIADARGRSPSEQVNQPARQLEEFLRSRDHRVAIERVVLLSHPRSRVGRCSNPTVHVATSIAQVIDLLNGSVAGIPARERGQLEELIVRDHRHHQARRPSR